MYRSLSLYIYIYIYIYVIYIYLLHARNYRIICVYTYIVCEDLTAGGVVLNTANPNASDETRVLRRLRMIILN